MDMSIQPLQPTNLNSARCPPKNKILRKKKKTPFTKFAVIVKQMVENQEKKGEEEQFQTFKVKVKAYEESESANFDYFKIKIAELRETSSEPEIKRNQFMEFAKIRHQNCSATVIDLKVCDLREVIAYVHKEGLMHERIYTTFQLNYKEREQPKFVQIHRRYQLMQKNQRNRKGEFGQEEHNYIKKTLFGLIDHRLFCQMLIEKSPTKYEMSEFPRCFTFETNQYLCDIYRMELGQFLGFFDAFNQKLKRFWMPRGEELMENWAYFGNILGGEKRCSKALRQVFNADEVRKLFNAGEVRNLLN